MGNLMLFLPELTLLISGLVFFMLSLTQYSERTTRLTAIILYSFTALAALVSLKAQGDLFYSAYRIDLFSQSFKLCIALASLLVVIVCGSQKGIKEKYLAEYHIFQAMSVLGLMMLVSSVELLAVFVSLELSSFAVYIMVPIRADNQGARFTQMEAGMKYLLFGVVATGCMLFGMSYLFGLTGSTQFSDIARALPHLYHQPVVVVSCVLVLAGFFYKLALFPFHFWVPDVYEGASNETTAFIVSVPKIAAVALLVRLCQLFDSEAQSLTPLITVCALASMFYGNLLALVQKDFKRMLGFSGIAHAGFILLGLLSFHPSGYALAVYYILGYALMNLVCFLVLCSVSADGENVSIQDLTGLYKHSPLMAFSLLVGLFALAGIPPFVGFTGKFMLLVNAFKGGFYLLVTLSAVNTAIAIYYYLNVVRIAFCSADENTTKVVRPSFVTQTASILLVFFIVAMGIFPNTFTNFTLSAIQQMF